MKKLNDSTSSPLRFIEEDGTVHGQFYNSWDKKYHLATYIPYKQPPHRYLCGGTGNFSSSRSEGDRRVCASCFEALALKED